MSQKHTEVYRFVGYDKGAIGGRLSFERTQHGGGSLFLWIHSLKPQSFGFLLVLPRFFL